MVCIMSRLYHKRIMNRLAIGIEYGKESWGADLTGLANLSGLPQNAAILIDIKQLDGLYLVGLYLTPCAYLKSCS
jgi:hypothetical protein